MWAAPPGITVRTKTPFLLQSSLEFSEVSLETVVAATFLTPFSRMDFEQSSLLRGRTLTLTPRVKAEARREVGIENDRFLVFTSERPFDSVDEDPETEISKVWSLTNSGSKAKYFRESSSTFLTSWKCKQITKSVKVVLFRICYLQCCVSHEDEDGKNRGHWYYIVNSYLNILNE